MNRLTNTVPAISLCTIGLHWSVAMFILFLLWSGLLVVEISYYHPWFYWLNNWHKTIGVLVFLLLLWQLSNHIIGSFRVAHTENKTLIRLLAISMHRLLMITGLVAVISGYLIVTISGQDLILSETISIPFLLKDDGEIRHWVGVIHRYSAYLLIGGIGMHILAALKHHFIDKDVQLLRLLGRHHTDLENRS